ncbi:MULTISPECIES: PspC domain-containing protein [unclassified Acinetobacter]|uniref:PspC domain-containing protein n=1 Tax=unclassified Acinetobacter TaxID=196816 RepID=UPI002934810D|nr:MULTISPECIES: PspC domain-containing protein [unclassified Acinetobacter]WOE30559.1 PspC domain-containing protein [Acinetobacter sp. SAAs470]WOE38751.1 PspC domain-containing protein [Acinetobacter sp. SAAs474]
MSHTGLYRSDHSKIIAGVMGGIAQRFGWNANLLRLIFILVSCFSAGFPGILIYLILWLIIPKQPHAVLKSPYSQPIRTIQSETKH